MNRLKSLLAAVSMLFIISCNNSSSNKIALNEMKTIMWDMVCADEMFADASLRDTTLKAKKDNIRLYEQVFSIHKISKKEFYDTYHYYQLHPEEFKILMDSLQNYSSRQKNKAGKPALKNFGD